jgi:phosphate transport system substrate-binding protein
VIDENIIKQEYVPFTENNKVVLLPEVSTLKLYDNLPSIDGATALYPLYASFVQAVYPEGEYSSSGRYKYNNGIFLPSIDVNGTKRAYNNLIDGKVDLIFCAKPSFDQVEKAKEMNINFQLTPIGKEAFVFFVNKRNSISNLTTEQIKDIYSGRITNWIELGGKKKEIKVFQRSKNSGSQTMLISIMDGGGNHRSINR